MFTLKINNRHSNNTQLDCPSYGDYIKNYKLRIGNETSVVNEKDGYYLMSAINIINTFGNMALDKIDYDLLKNNANYKSLLKYVKLLYPYSLNCRFCEGRVYGLNEGKIYRIELKLEARWPWSINKITINGSEIEIKYLVLKSEWTSQFCETLESQIITPSGITYNIPSSYSWSLSTIKAVCILIAGSYLKGLNWTETFEGRIFNSGDDIDELIRKGYIKMNGFG